jgi:c-di-GMP-binding flagellar brake protein YcgR
MNDQFYVGQKLSLGINDSDTRLDLFVVGWDEGRFIVGKSHTLRDARITSKDDCIIRFVKEGVAFGFQTTLMSVQYAPVPLVFFKYPDEIKSMSIRKSSRVKANIPAKLMVKKENDKFITEDARICDMSENGCLIEVPTVKFSDTESLAQCYVTFLLLDKNLEFDCNIRNVRKKDNVYYLGSEFSNCQPESKNILTSFICMFSTS